MYIYIYNMVFNFSVFMNSCCLSLDSAGIDRNPRFLVLAETQLPISPEKSGKAVAKAQQEQIKNDTMMDSRLFKCVYISSDHAIEHNCCFCSLARHLKN